MYQNQSLRVVFSIDVLYATAVYICYFTSRKVLLVVAEVVVGMDVLILQSIPVPRWESFCAFDTQELIHGKLVCNCGENKTNFEWAWKPSGGSHIFQKENREIIFHPVYSPGTAAARGTCILDQNRHHFWEIKILTKLYGTDVMIGIGTADVSLEERRHKFCSMLGYDDKSWGFSYRGHIQHNGLIRDYGNPYGLGSIIGVHLDMYNGTMEYYLNRKPLGIAFRGLKNKDLYPMVCSTAAQSAIQLIAAYSFEDTLEIRCLGVVANNIELTKRFSSIPGLVHLIKRQHLWRVPYNREVTKQENELTFEDETVLPLDSIWEVKSRQRKRPRTIGWSLECRTDPDHISHREFFRKVNPSPKSKKNGRFYTPSCQKCTLKSQNNVEQSSDTTGEKDGPTTTCSIYDGIDDEMYF